MHRLKVFGAGLIVCGVVCLIGCGPSGGSQDNWLLVSFEKDVPVSYKMTSVRTTQIDLTGGKSSKKSKPQRTAEKLTLEMVYTPVEVDPFGLTVLKAECTSATVSRQGFTGKQEKSDAAEQLKGKQFTLTLSPTGRIEDQSDLERVARELGQAAFSAKNNTRIKNPDMIADFLAMQQFLWDAGATVADQLDLEIGDQWQSQQAVAWPVPMYPPPARTTTYTLESIRESAPETPARQALITSAYALSETPMETYIRPYEEGRFQMQGLFGFLRNYQFKSLEGTGRQVFDLDSGLVESDEQHYTMNVNAGFMLPLGDSVPVLTVDQTFTIERIQGD